MRRAHRETVDVLARFGRDGRLEPCVVMLKDCRAFRIDEVLMASGFDPVHHGKRTARFDIRLGGRKRSCSWSISWKTPPRVRRINMYGGCALSTEQSEAPPKAADARVGCAGGLALRAPLATGGVGAVAPVASGSVSSLVGATAVVDVEARWRRGVLWCCWPPSCALALRGSGGAGFHVRLTPQCRGAVGVGVFAVWLPLALRMLWVVRCHEGSGVVVGGSRCSAAPGSRALGRFVDAGWQDSRAVHDSRGPRSEKGPFLARSSRGASPNARLRGFSDARRAYLAKAGSFRMHGGDILPGRGAFPVRGPFGNA